MANVIYDLMQRAESLEKELSSGDMFAKIIMDNEAYIVELNAQQQLYEKGVNSLNIAISSYSPYSNLTIEIKKEKGQPTNRVTLRDEGDFHASFYVGTLPDAFYIYATDDKTEKLEKKYGSAIFGLTPDSRNELAWGIMYGELLTSIREILTQ